MLKSISSFGKQLSLVQTKQTWLLSKSKQGAQIAVVGWLEIDIDYVVGVLAA